MGELDPANRDGYSCDHHLSYVLARRDTYLVRSREVPLGVPLVGFIRRLPFFISPLGV
jgi:hypothetical protein